MIDEEFIEIQGLVNIILCRIGKSSNNRTTEQVDLEGVLEQVWAFPDGGDAGFLEGLTVWSGHCELLCDGRLINSWRHYTFFRLATPIKSLTITSKDHCATESVGQTLVNRVGESHNRVSYLVWVLVSGIAIHRECHHDRHRAVIVRTVDDGILHLSRMSFGDKNVWFRKWVMIRKRVGVWVFVLFHVASPRGRLDKALSIGRLMWIVRCSLPGHR